MRKEKGRRERKEKKRRKRERKRRAKRDRKRRTKRKKKERSKSASFLGEKRVLFTSSIIINHIEIEESLLFNQI